jgi:MFS family permease
MTVPPGKDTIAAPVPAASGATPQAAPPPAERDQPNRQPQPASGRRGLGANFYRLVSASSAANVADGIFQVALPLMAATLTRSPALIAAVTLAARLPWLLVALPAGALADRLDRRRTMLLVDLARTVIIGGLALATAMDLTSIWLLIVVAFALGVAETLFDTAAQSILPAVADRDRLSIANGRLYAAELTAHQFVGPPLGGLLVGLAAAGVAIAFGVTAGLYAAAALLLLTLRGSFRPQRPEGAERGLWADVIEGVRYLAGNRLLATLGFMTGMQNLVFTATISVLVLYATGEGSAMGLTAAQYGLLLTGWGVGAVLGSLATPFFERWFGRSNLLLIAVASGAASLLVPALTANPYAIGIGFVIGSMLTVCWNVVTVSLRQRVAPDRLLGRVNAGYRLLAWGSMPLGAALGGSLAELFGLRATFAISSAVGIALLFLRPFITDARIAAAEANAEGAAEPAR